MKSNWLLELKMPEGTLYFAEIGGIPNFTTDIEDSQLFTSYEDATDYLAVLKDEFPNLVPMLMKLRVRSHGLN